MTAFTIISILSLAALGLVANLLNRFSRGRGGNDDAAIMADGNCGACSAATGSSSSSSQSPGGSTACRTCGQECMLEAAVSPIEYFDDEELDRYRSRPSDSYTDEETEQFAYVLHTLQPGEVAAWSRSLTLRDIAIPDALRDELLLLLEA